MLKKSVFILIIGLTIFNTISCKKSITASDNIDELSKLKNLLESAYKQKSQDKLDEFFSFWIDLIPSYDDTEISSFSDTVKQIYNIFTEFYSPTDLNRLSNGWHEDFKVEFRYIVVQNNIEYSIKDTIPEYYTYDELNIHSINDFRPDVEDKSYPAVYLSTEVDSILYNFLYSNQGTPKLDIENRVNFLMQAIQLTHHHWINDFHKVTMPIASEIIMNKSLT